MSRFWVSTRNKGAVRVGASSRPTHILACFYNITTKMGVSTFLRQLLHIAGVTGGMPVSLPFLPIYRAGRLARSSAMLLMLDLAQTCTAMTVSSPAVLG